MRSWSRENSSEQFYWLLTPTLSSFGEERETNSLLSKSPLR